MKEKLTETAEKAKAFIGKLSGKTRVLLIVVLSAIVVGAVVLALVLNNRPYTVLFTELSGTDASSIMALLEENGVTDYKVQNSDTILVRRDQESSLKARIIQAGYPKSGFAYQHSMYFDNTGALATESDRKTATRLDLQENLASVIRCMDGVKSASVIISQGEDRRYILDSSNMVKATAAVVVEMKNGTSLEPLVAAIRNLVARSVSGLEFDSISISDSMGNTYSGSGSAGASDASALKLQMEEQINNKVRTQIMQVLVPLYGEENIRIAVNSAVDVSRTIGESTTYTTPEGAPDGKGIIGSRVFSYEIAGQDMDFVGGVAGTTSNSDLPTYVEQNPGLADGSEYIYVTGEEDNKVNSQVQQTERVAGTVTDLSVSVTINRTTAGQVNAQTLLGHIARAAGITPEQQDAKISILAEPFYNPEQPVLPVDPGGFLDNLPIPKWMVYAAGGGLLLFLILLIVIFSAIRRKKKKKANAMALEAGLTFANQPSEVQQVGADIMNIKNERSMELRKDIRQFAESNPEIAAQLVKGWLKGGDESA